MLFSSTISFKKKYDVCLKITNLKNEIYKIYNDQLVNFLKKFRSKKVKFKKIKKNINH